MKCDSCRKDFNYFSDELIVEDIKNPNPPYRKLLLCQKCHDKKYEMYKALYKEKK